MKNGALHKRLQKAKGKHSVVLSIRFSVTQVQMLDEIEMETSVRYDWWIRQMLCQFLKMWERDKPRIVQPLHVFVFSHDEALEKGLIEQKPKGEVTFLAEQKHKKKR